MEDALRGGNVPDSAAGTRDGALRGAGRLACGPDRLGDLAGGLARARALLIAQELGRRGRGVLAAGWILLFLSIVIFTFVDGMTGYVFPPLAAAANASAFEGLKRLWDVLFLLGTAAYGAGVVAAMGGEARTGRTPVDRFLVRALVVVGLIGGLDAVAGLLAVAGLPTDKIAGASIGLGSALFVPISLRIARTSAET
jgi:hypothetical protein